MAAARLLDLAPAGKQFNRHQWCGCLVSGIGPRQPSLSGQMLTSIAVTAQTAATAEHWGISGGDVELPVLSKVSGRSTDVQWHLAAF